MINFIDTEFIEGFHKPMFGKRRHFIDLISIGIVAEDGREYYAISKDFNPSDADDWVTRNVLESIVTEHVMKYSGDQRNWILDQIGEKDTRAAIKVVQSIHGKSNKEIANDIMQFVFHEAYKDWDGSSVEFYERGKKYGWGTSTPINFYAYYADYDWVLFCSLFGRMIDLPSGFPMYCNDLLQMCEERGHDGLWRDARCPANKNEHNALADARWNKRLYEAIINETNIK